MNIYIIGICGKASGNLAIFLKQQGHNVMGSEFSEDTFYPPISDLIIQNEIKVDFSFDPLKIDSKIDLVILGGAALIHDKNNPQVKKAYELGIPVISVAKAIGKFISKDNHISVVGNHGKTTITSLLVNIFKEAGIDVSYFIGEASNEINSIYQGTSDWSIAEGDEHPSLFQEPGGKFLYHKPKHVVFTSADWDHKNIYTTKKSYLNTFQDLFKIIPSDGKIIANLDGINVLKVLNDSKIKNDVFFYSVNNFNDLFPNYFEEEIDNKLIAQIHNLKDKYQSLFQNIKKVFYVFNVDYKWKPEYSRFGVKVIDCQTMQKDIVGSFETKLIGPIGIENSLAAVATGCVFNLNIDAIKNAVSKFQAPKRRLEIVYNQDYIVIDDYAHSPIKIKSSIKSVRAKYFDRKIFAIFQVQQSGLKERRTFLQLKNVFNFADFVIVTRVIPDFNAEIKFYGKDYRDLIRSGAMSRKNGTFLIPQNVFYAPLESQIKSILENNLSKGDVILVMSSGNNKNIIDLVKNLKINTLNI